MSYSGKYALAKHETLALKCEALECQLEEAREEITKLKECINEIRNRRGKTMSHDLLKKMLKEKGDE